MAETLAEILFHLEEMGSGLRMQPIKRRIPTGNSIRTITDYKLPTSTAKLWQQQQYRLLGLLEIQIQHKDIPHAKLNQYLNSFEKASKVNYDYPRDTYKHYTFEEWNVNGSDEYTERIECLDHYKKMFFNRVNLKIGGETQGGLERIECLDHCKKIPFTSANLKIDGETQGGFEFLSQFKEEIMKEIIRSVMGKIVLEADLYKIERLLDSFDGFKQIKNKKRANPNVNMFKIPLAKWRELEKDKIRIKLPVGKAFKVFMSLETSGVLEPMRGINKNFYSELFQIRDLYKEEYESIDPGNVYVFRSRGRNIDDLFLKEYGLFKLGKGDLQDIQI